MKRTIIKKIGSTCLFLLTLTTLLVIHYSLVSADYRDVLKDVGDKTQLQNYETTVHADASSRSGVKNITSAVFFAIDFVKYALGSVAVLMLIINAVQTISAGKETEDHITKEKTYFKYAAIGLMTVFVADEAIKLAFFGEEGEFLRDEETAAEYGAAGNDILKGVYTFFQVFLGSVAVLILIYSGFQILVAAGSEEAVNSAKKRVFLSAIGLVIVGLSETIVKDVVFKNQGEEIDVERGREILVSLTNFLVSAIGTISVLVFVYAGFLYIVNFGNEEFTNKAKKMLLGAVIGIALAGAAFAIVSTVIPVEGAQ